ncbi:MAG: hypothetical protein RIC19_01965 [Phaeodactylibacter sp.]|uniref:hypothetical protein n=1 Tax=Phaeodactylibacter sp. TaxID=1940289 RepID=UPI0032EE2AAC
MDIRNDLLPAMERRLLGFLNRIDNATALSEAIRDRNQNSGTGIGEKVAERILKARNDLPGRHFQNLKQVEAVPGLGKDKILDLMHAFKKPAAQAFRSSMYNGVILNNWELEYFTSIFENEAAFQEIIDSKSSLAEFVGDQVEQISLERYSNSKAAELAGELVERCYDEYFPDSHFGAYALALWFYQFDADNWFSFERVLKETEKYLNFYPEWEDRLELHLYKGFDNTGVLVDPVTQVDLPVVINRGERAITIWTCQLND